MKKTAVEWLFEKLPTIDKYDPYYEEIFQQAKAMEKEQIINAWDKRGDRIVPKYFLQENITGEQYYNENFKSE